MQPLKPIVLSTAILGSASFACAELPPQYTRWNDFGAITSQAEIAHRLGRPVDRIEALEDGTFRVQAGSCSLLVRISRRGQTRNGEPVAGPSVIDGLEIGEPRCK